MPGPGPAVMLAGPLLRSSSLNLLSAQVRGGDVGTSNTGPASEVRNRSDARVPWALLSFSTVASPGLIMKITNFLVL